MTVPRVVVVVINWNRCDDTLACLASLRRVEYPACEIVVVDNGSRDDSVARLRAAYPQVQLIAEAENSGFVGGSNRGIRTARSSGAEYILLLNNDAIIAPDCLTLLADAAAPGDVAAVGPTIYFHDRHDVICSAGERIDWKRGRTITLRFLEHERDGGPDVTAPHEVDFVSGCCLLVKASAIDKVGELDERFFAYFEETEWCVRMQRAGLRILHVPRARLWHKINLQQQAQSPLVRYYMTRNKLLFLKATGAPWTAWFHTLVFDYARTLVSWSVRPKWRAQRLQRDVMLRAIADYCKGRLGRAPEYET
ncbi:MAG TPA: glycosyltransferase family 2 protein [Candidatus Acidoferrales bacterium]|nr:glycosyltransferase family 2 protein [Candidatus Acidoferrales bacterium]